MNAAGGAAAGAAAAAAIANAIRSFGTVVRVEPAVFMYIVQRQAEPLVVHAPQTIFLWSGHQYICSYKGLCFFTRSSDLLPLPVGTELIESRAVQMPF